MIAEYAGPGYINADDSPACRYCPDHPTMDRLTLTVYECPKCAYEMNLDSAKETGDE
jgi:ribosomal protein L37AE/L43A